MNSSTFLSAQYPCWEETALQTRSTSDLTYLPSLSIPPQDEWRLHEPPKEEPGGLEERKRELTQLFPEVWVEDNSSSPKAG